MRDKRRLTSPTAIHAAFFYPDISSVAQNVTSSAP
jgi:hypothetical protein